jgi:nitroimidazol reductase NimA-like FMN-containing flavoprotein (pyridoxamine 5'-phosphate oxidase superfamily)
MTPDEVSHTRAEGAEMADSWLEDLDLETCLAHLREGVVGRVGVVVDEYPIVLPVNYRLVETLGLTWVALRTRPGNVIDQASNHVAFEIDGIDASHHRGWSVLVRGTLLPIDTDAASFRERFDSEPWLTIERDAWRVIEPFSITGRALHPAEQEWAFHHRSYL